MRKKCTVKKFKILFFDFSILKMFLKWFNSMYQLKFFIFLFFLYILCTVKNFAKKYTYCGGYKSYSFKGRDLNFWISIDHIHGKNPWNFQKDWLSGTAAKNRQRATVMYDREGANGLIDLVHNVAFLIICRICGLWQQEITGLSAKGKLLYRITYNSMNNSSGRTSVLDLISIYFDSIVVQNSSGQIFISKTNFIIHISCSFA